MLFAQGAAEGRCAGLRQRQLGAHIHSIGHGSDRELKILDATFPGDDRGEHADVRAEAVGLRAHLVALARAEAEDLIAPLRVGNRCADLPRLRVGDRHIRAADDRATLILNDAFD